MNAPRLSTETHTSQIHPFTFPFPLSSQVVTSNGPAANSDLGTLNILVPSPRPCARGSRSCKGRRWGCGKTAVKTVVRYCKYSNVATQPRILNVQAASRIGPGCGGTGMGTVGQCMWCTSIGECKRTIGGHRCHHAGTAPVVNLTGTRHIQHS
jgi:hypothetical protein